jgi:RecJ-like exonuclease
MTVQIVGEHPMAESLRDIDFDEEEDSYCPRCGGEGYIMAADGDGSDWGEDCYAGPLDAEIECRECRGTGLRVPPSTRNSR